MLGRMMSRFGSTSFRTLSINSLNNYAAPSLLPQIRNFHRSVSPRAETVSITFVDKHGSKTVVDAEIGDSILEVSQKTAVEDIEGACEGTCTCSTCHIYLGDTLFTLLDEPGDEELDMLDLAPAVTDKSRLGCQVIVTKEFDGRTIQLPSEVQNFYD